MVAAAHNYYPADSGGIADPGTINATGPIHVYDFLMSEEQQTTSSIWQKIAMGMILCLVIPVAILFSLELGAGLSPKCFPTSLFVKEKMSDGSEFLRVNYQVGYRYFPGRLARKPLAEIMPTPKPKDRLRFFVLGESAARGEQLADFSFARILETVINDGASPKKVEIINTGIPAINSWVLSEFASEIMNYEPDLIIIYAGHNEFIGPYGPASVFGLTRSRFGAKTGIWASSLNLVQLLRHDSPAGQFQNGWKGLEMFLRNQIPSSSPAIDVCLDNWQKNLEEIMQQAKQSAVPVLWCRVPVNLRDCAPFISNEDALTDSNRAAIAITINHAAKVGAENLLAEIEKQRQKAPDHALLCYLAARGNLKTGRIDVAEELFKKALAEDRFRVRINESFNNAASEVALRYGAIVADVEAEFKKHSESGIVGKDLIYDHVHLTEAGHYYAARSIFQTLKNSDLAFAKKLPQAFPDLPAAQKATGFSSNDRIQNLEHIISSLRGIPFTLQYGHEEYLTELENMLQQAKSSNNLSENLQITNEALQNQPYNSAISLRMAMMQLSQPAEAQQYFALSLAANPWNIDTLNNSGLMLMTRNSNQEAEKAFHDALKLAPDFARAHFNLGVIKTGSNNLIEAEKHYREALKSDPAMVGAWRNLANLSFKNKDFAGALKTYQQAANAVPHDMMTQLGVGNCLMELGQFAEAASIYQNCVLSFPGSPLPFFSLGLACNKMNKYLEASAAFIKAGESGYLPGYNKAIELHLTEKHSLSPQQFLQVGEKACEQSEFTDPWLMQIYASALLGIGQNNEALSILHRARDLAQQSGKQELAAEIEANIKAWVQN